MSQDSNKPAEDTIHIMTDIETLDTTSTAVILSIGACVVGQNPALEPPDLFYYEVNPHTQYMRTKSLATEAWWQEQGNCPNGGIINLDDALGLLRTYIESFGKRPIIWCKGTDFDVSILTHAYGQLGAPTPWKYNDVRDFRTIKKMFGDSMIVTIENPQPHHALEDAIFQARQLHSIGLELK